MPTIHGNVNLKIAPGSQSGTKMRLKSKGIVTDKQAGDQYVTLEIKLPQAVDEDLQNFAETYGQKHPYTPRSF